MTNVIKFPEKRRLDVEVLSWGFSNNDRSLEINYFKNGQEKNLELPKGQLLDYLNRSHIVDTVSGEEVTFSGVHDFYDAGEPDGHGQQEYSDRMNIVEFMNEMLTEEDVNRLVLFHEEQIENKRIARFFADKLQHTIKGFVHTH